MYVTSTEEAPITALTNGMTIWRAGRAGICAVNALQRMEDTCIYDTKQRSCFKAQNLTSFVVSNNICTNEHQYKNQTKATSLTDGIWSTGKSKLFETECSMNIAFDPKVPDYGTKISKALKNGCKVRLLAG